MQHTINLDRLFIDGAISGLASPDLTISISSRPLVEYVVRSNTLPKMVRSLPMPSVKAKTSLQNLTSNNQTTPSSSCPATPRPSLLSDALRNNPFGLAAARSKSAQTLGREEASLHREELNNDLTSLCSLFPNIQIEVFRELLSRYDAGGDSRLHICVDQLVRYEAEWVKGRWNVKHEHGPVEPEYTFRSEEYKVAVRATLGLEMKSLSRSAIEAVLAENNYCYARSRPILRDVARKSWRNVFENIFSFRKKKTVSTGEDDPMVLWQGSERGTKGVPYLKSTGCFELDRELEETLLRPIMDRIRADREMQDLQVARDLALKEAKTYESLFECQCCYDDVPFEEISACSSSAHVICFNCLRRTVDEALFGQGWDQAVSLEKGTLVCLAPLADESCCGTLSPDLVCRAVKSGSSSGNETWKKFEERLGLDSLRKSNVKLVQCPFCSYSEVDPLARAAKDIDPKHTDHGKFSWRFRSIFSDSSPIPLTTFLLLIPIILFLFFLFVMCLGSLDFQAHFSNSLRLLALKNRDPRFQCRNPTCKRTSCLKCFKSWHDIHKCHETLITSLRTAVEAARTAAIKRTCPRCGLSFVKASGCNKLTCVCGYMMCYLCRKCLGGDGGAPGLLGPGVEREGYKHFCGHFRVNPGSACSECDKCDLYRVENEDAIVKAAGEAAEKEWRVREGMVGVEGFEEEWKATSKRIAAGDKSDIGLLEQVWSQGVHVPGLLDYVVEKMVIVDN